MKRLAVLPKVTSSVEIQPLESNAKDDSVCRLASTRRQEFSTGIMNFSLFGATRARRSTTLSSVITSRRETILPILPYAMKFDRYYRVTSIGERLRIIRFEKVGKTLSVNVILGKLRVGDRSRSSDRLVLTKPSSYRLVQRGGR